jgi:ATPase
MGRHVTGPIEVDMISDGKAVVRVTGDDIPKVIGRGGSTIDRLENQLGLSIDVRELEGSSRKPGVMSSEMRPLVEQTKRHLILDVPDLAAMDVEIFIGQDYLFTATVSRHGEIKIRKNSPVAADILEAIEAGEAVTVRSV